MADPVVGITAGVPTSGTGTITTLGQVAHTQGANLTTGESGSSGPLRGPMVQGSTVSTPPTYTAGTANPLTTDTSGNLRVSTPANVTAGTTWNSSTTLNSTQTIANNPSILGQVTVGSTITAGALTFEESYDNGTTWLSVPAGRLINPATGAQIANPYTLVASTNLQFQIVSTGTTQMRVRLSTAITGTGTAAFSFTSSPLINEVQVYQNNAANLKVDLSGTATNSNPVNVNGTVGTVGNTASGTPDAGSPVKVGGIAKTTQPTAVTDAQRTDATFDKQGKQICVGALRQLKGVAKVSLTVATEQTLIAAGGAGVFNDVYAFVVTNKSATNVFVDFKDSTGGTTRMTMAAPAGDTRGFTVPVDSAMVQATANNNWTATVSSAVTSIEITALYVSNL